MTKKQFYDLYLGKAVHCDTEEKANEFLELAHGVGYKWYSRESLLEKNYYHYYQEATCYLVDRDGFEYCDKSYYIEKGYEVVEFKQEKENNMKYKVGDKVRVRKDLVARRDYDGEIYGRDLFVHSMAHLRGEVVTIESVFDEKYLIEEDNGTWNWTDEMLEPVEEVFNVGDVVYNKEGKKLVIKDVMYYTVDDNNVYHNVEPYELSKTKPLQKLTRKELAKKGYELVD